MQQSMFEALHPATREWIGIGAYTFVVVASIALLVRSRGVDFRMPFRASLRDAFVGFSIASVAGWVAGVVLNTLFHADFCIYLVLCVATLGGGLATVWFASKRGSVERFTSTAMLVIGTIEVLAIPMFLLG